jgi:hypothetical protein
MQQLGTHRLTTSLDDRARDRVHTHVSLATLRGIGPLPPAAVAWVGSQVARQLAAIDEERQPLGLIHESLTPETIVVDDAGAVLLLPPDVARDALDVIALRFLSPELHCGEAPSVASDLWALGMALWEAALGRVAVPGDDEMERARLLEGALIIDDDGGRLPARLVDAIAALVAPAYCRVHNARAVSRIFDSLVYEWPGGATLLHDVVVEARDRAVDDDPRTILAFGGFAARDDVTETAHYLRGPHGTLALSREQAREPSREDPREALQLDELANDETRPHMVIVTPAPPAPVVARAPAPKLDEGLRPTESYTEGFTGRVRAHKRTPRVLVKDQRIDVLHAFPQTEPPRSLLVGRGEMAGVVVALVSVIAVGLIVIAAWWFTGGSARF